MSDTAPTQKKRLCFLIRQLNAAGAENQMAMTVKGLDKSKWDITVLTFYDGGPLFDQVTAIPGVRLISLNKRGRWDMLPFMRRLLRELRAADPDVLYAFLGISNILSALAKPFLRRTRIVWSIRTAGLDHSRYSRLHVLMYRIECALSRFADLVISNSYAGRDYSIANGFPASRTVVIPNGTDTDRYAPDAEARRKVRAEWGVGDDEVLVGIIGRIDPEKDHATFLKAAAALAKKHENVKFVCVGLQKGEYAQEIVRLGESLGLSDRLIWAGIRTDMPAVHNAMDVVVSASLSEGFSNVVAEAMSCGVRCVVTDAGDSPIVVGDRGAVIPMSAPEQLAEAVSGIMGDITGEPSAAIRARIVEHFSVDKMIAETEERLCCLLSTD